MAAAGDMPRPTPLPLAGAVETGGPIDDSDPTMLAARPEPTTIVQREGIEPEGIEPAGEDPMNGDGAEDDDLEVWPFVAVTSAAPADPDTAADPGPEVDLDLTRAEPAGPVVREVASSDPAPAAIPAPLTADEPYVAERPKRARRSWRRWALIVFVFILLVAVGVSAGALVADLTATPTHEVPAVMGLDVDAAREKLAANHWDIRSVTPGATTPTAGEVLDVEPGVGESVREGETVTLVVSDGQTIATVPTDLAGKPVSDATRVLERAGFEVRTVSAFNEDVPADHVIRVARNTKPKLPKGETVSLLVSKGPEPRTIPEGLAGKTLDEVVGILGQLKLTPKVERHVPRGAPEERGHRHRSRGGGRGPAGLRGQARGLRRARRLSFPT